MKFRFRYILPVLFILILPHNNTALAAVEAPVGLRRKRLHVADVQRKKAQPPTMKRTSKFGTIVEYGFFMTSRDRRELERCKKKCWRDTKGQVPGCVDICRIKVGCKRKCKEFIRKLPKKKRQRRRRNGRLKGRLPRCVDICVKEETDETPSPTPQPTPQPTPSPTPDPRVACDECPCCRDIPGFREAIENEQFTICTKDEQPDIKDVTYLTDCAAPSTLYMSFNLDPTNTVNTFPTRACLGGGAIQVDLTQEEGENCKALLEETAAAANVDCTADGCVIGT